MDPPNDAGRQFRTTFDREADRYDRIRPAPPAALIDAVLEQGQLKRGDRVLEVGCGTGQATRPLAERGLKVHALELGPALAAKAQHNLKNFPNVTVELSAFETFQAACSFDTLVSVQAFHWIEPERGLELAARALRPGGHLLLAWHQDRSDKTAFYQATRSLHARYPEPPRPTPRNSVDTFEGAMAAPHFTPAATLRFSWRKRYSKRDYLDLLLTTSNVQALGEADRHGILTETARLIDQHGGKVERHYVSVLLSAERLPH